MLIITRMPLEQFFIGKELFTVTKIKLSSLEILIDVEGHVTIHQFSIFQYGDYEIKFLGAVIRHNLACARIGITAPKEVQIVRTEIIEKYHKNSDLIDIYKEKKDEVHHILQTTSSRTKPKSLRSRAKNRGLGNSMY